MKKLALTVASAVVLASAANAAMDGKHFTGFYVGGQIGYSSGKSEWTSTRTQAGINAAAGNGAASRKNDLGTHGFVGGLHVGFGKEFNNKMFLGLEAFGNLSKTEGKERATDNLATFRSRAKRKNEFGVALTPGFVCGNALISAIAGVSSAKWEYKSVFNAATYGQAVSSSTSKHRVGFVPGLKVSFMVSEHIMIGLKATHTIYKKQNNPVRFANNGNVVEAGRVKSRVSDVVFTVAHKW